MTSWSEKFTEFGCGELFATRDSEPNPFAVKQWDPSIQDKSAAWQLYTEMRSRITTQPLAARDGDEETALTSIYNIFGLTREAIKKHEGCHHCATLSIHVLNVHLRPFTAYWHKVKVAGRLSSSDTCHRFRRELVQLQNKLRLFMRLLGHLAEGDDFQPGTESGLESSRIYAEHDLGAAIEFGVTGSKIPIDNADQIDGAERTEVLRRRKTYGFEEKAEDAIGLAISGGGIRSATFSLGVVQYLARKGIIKSVDFVSTVSGGGYLGSFISSYLNDPGNPHATLQPGAENQPFGKRRTVESKAVRHLRNHSKYMSEGGFKTYTLAIAQMMWGIAVNLFLLLPVVLGAVLVANYVSGNAFIHNARTDDPANQMVNLAILVAVVLLIATVFLPVVQNLGRNAGLKHPQRRALANGYEHLCIGLFAALLGLLFWNLLPIGYRWYHSVIYRWDGPQGLNEEYRTAMLAAAAGAGPFLAGLLQFADKGAGLLKKLGLALLVISGPIFFLVVFFVLVDYFVDTNDGTAVPMVLGLEPISIMWVLLVAVTLYSLCLNINFTSPHRYYRRQLSRTYLRRSKNGAEETEHIDLQPLSTLNRGDANVPSKAPYHLINCALNIPACDDPNLRGRNSDFFVFSKHYCGSPITGYCATEEWEAIDGHLDLATAMSISAAAASPQMGTNTDAKISYLLSILNVRLNYWASPPRKPSDPGTLRHPRWLLRLRTPSSRELLKEMTGLRMNENSNFLNLSDGGHVENLALYELLRRRCKFIIAIDGEADPERTFHGLLTIVRLAKIDLGVTLDPRMEDLRRLKNGDSRSHFLLCEIDYGHHLRGYLLYVKSSMTGNESEFLQNYRREHPSFPHQSTADQLFDEGQFEAYRALGEHVGEDLFRSDLVDPIEPDGEPLPEQPTVRQWFQGLANSLLD